MKKILAAIVTCNRLSLLQKSVDALRKQTCKLQGILIVDNGSSDGTFDWLQSQSDLLVIRQENLGSAGGQASALKWALSKDYEWIWLMDDDFLVSLDALEKIVSCADDNWVNVYGSIAVDENNPENICWRNKVLYSSGIWRVCEKVKDLPEGELIPTQGIPFLGMLINRKAVEKVGFPLEGLFIWCDDLEYCMRLQKNGIELFYARGSVGHHPAPRFLVRNFLWKRIEIVDAAPAKLFYGIRNSIFIKTVYSTGVQKVKLWISIPKMLIHFVVIALFLGPDKHLYRMRLYTKGVMDGIRGRLGKTI